MAHVIVIGAGGCCSAAAEASRAFARVAVALMADDHSIPARVLPGDAEFTCTFWMSMPVEAKHLARVQAVWGLLKEVGQRKAGVLVPGGERKVG